MFVCAHFNICNNFCNIEGNNFIFDMHVYLIEVHILSLCPCRCSVGPGWTVQMFVCPGLSLSLPNWCDIVLSSTGIVRDSPCWRRVDCVLLPG